MPINAAELVGTALPDRTQAWGVDDVILYGLGLGAGAPATSAQELAYVYERGLKVLPSFGVLAASQSLLDLFALDSFDVPLAQILHAEQELVLHGELPTTAEVLVKATVGALYDTGRNAVVVLETTTELVGTGQALCTNRFSIHVRGEGGFGGERGPARDAGAPERDPDHVVDCPILEQQALIYRLSGDRNPLHADPGFAAKAGFDRPILHGLCTYGVVAKAAVDVALGGDVASVASLRARFVGVVFPGETVQVSIWVEAGTLILSAAVPARDAVVLTGTLVNS